MRWIINAFAVFGALALALIVYSAVSPTEKHPPSPEEPGKQQQQQQSGAQEQAKLEATGQEIIDAVGGNTLGAAIPEKPESESSPYAGGTTAELLAKADGVIKVSSRDLGVQTHKWDGKIVQARLNCFYADVGDYRCTGPNARVDFALILPESAGGSIDRNCDTIEKSQRAACKKTVRFIYRGFHELDVGGFVGKLTVVVPAEGTAMVVP
jgi:hypothetical protein